MNYTKLKSAIAEIHAQKMQNALRADLYCYYFFKDFFTRYEVEKIDVNMSIYHNNSGYGGSSEKLRKNYEYKMYTFDPANPDKKQLYLIQDGQTSSMNDNSYGGARKIYNAVVCRKGTREIVFAQEVFKEFVALSLIHDEMRVSMDSKNWEWRMSASRDTLEEDFLKVMGRDKFDAMMAIKERDELDAEVPIESKNEFTDVFHLKVPKEGQGSKHKL